METNFVILGGTGHVGSVLAEQLLKDKQSVLVIGHNQEKEKLWLNKGAGFESADILDSEKLHQLFSVADHLFILNPPADPAKDAEAEEIKQIQSILKALEGLKPEKIVMASTYGARDEKQIFDLGTCYVLEQGLKACGSPLAIIRSAYYMSNLDMPTQIAAESGKLTTLFPANFKLPMVAPQDIGKFAEQLIQDERTGTFYIEAGQAYSASDAVQILNDILQKDIQPNEIPEKEWATYMQQAGFSPESAQSFIGMTKLTLNEKFEAPAPHIGQTTLREYLQQFIEALK